MISDKKASQVIAKLKNHLKMFDNNMFNKKRGFFDVQYADRESSKENLIVEFYFNNFDGEQLMKFATAFHHLSSYKYSDDAKKGFQKVDNGIARTNVKAESCPKFELDAPMICFEIWFNDFNKFLNDGK